MTRPEFQWGLETTPPSDGPISHQDLLQQELEMNPDKIIADHQQRQNEAQEHISQLNMERIRREQEELTRKLAESEAINKTLLSDQAHMRGQLDAIQQMNQAPVETGPSYSPEELELYGDSKDFVAKTARAEIEAEKAKMREEIRGEMQVELDSMKAQLNQTMKATQTNAELMQENFKTELERAANSVGLSIEKLAYDPAFEAHCNKPFAAGDRTPWGKRFQANIDNHDIEGCTAMLAQYAGIANAEARTQPDPDTFQVPTSTGARPQEIQAHQNLSLREKLIAKVDKLQSDFLAGRYPGTQEEYQNEKAKWIEKIDEVPSN